RHADEHVPPELHARAAAARRVPAPARREARRGARRMTAEEEELLVEQVAGAHRTPPKAFGELVYHPAWHDLPDAARGRAFERAVAMRVAEAALDPEGLSTTARAVLARIRRGT